jgi:DNA helicase IV
MVSLVDEQMDFLEISSGKTRVICRGGAGTGKTLLGLEYTRLRRAKGLKVLFVVPSQMFFRYLVNRGYRESWIITFEETGKIENHSLDMVVIDESQDLMSLKNFQKIDKILKGGISRGSWLILIDDQNQTGIDGKFDTDYYTRLKSFSEIDFLLPRNIRNTKEIIDVTKLLTSRDIGKKGTGLGSVRFIKYKNTNEMGVNVCAYIKDQRIKDLKDDMIVILGKDDIGLSVVAREIKRNGHTVTELNRNNIAGYPLDSIMYSSIKDFKGIEAFIIIVDIGEFPTEEALASTLLYVAVTRATGHLILLYPESMKEIIAETEYKNRNKL